MDQQCVAPHGNNRCENKIEQGCKFHCSVHKAKAHKLYETYKKICNIAETLDPNGYQTRLTWQEKLQFLQRCYIVYKRAYDARMDHRQYSFVPYFYDFGHNLQFFQLKAKYKLCETLMEKVLESRAQVQEKVIPNTLFSSEEDLAEPSHNIRLETLRQISEFRKQRLQDKRKLEHEMQHFQNESRLEKLEQIKWLQPLKTKLESIYIGQETPYNILLHAFQRWLKAPSSGTIILLSEQKQPDIHSLSSVELRYWHESLSQHVDVFRYICSTWQFQIQLIPILEWIGTSWRLVNKSKNELTLHEPNISVLLNKANMQDLTKTSAKLCANTPIILYSLMFSHLETKDLHQLLLKDRSIRKITQKEKKRRIKLKNGLKLQLFCTCCVPWGSSCAAEATIQLDGWIQYFTLPFETFNTVSDLIQYIKTKHFLRVQEEQWKNWQIELEELASKEEPTIYTLQQKIKLGEKHKIGIRGDEYLL